MRRRCDLYDRLMVSLLTNRGELSRVHGKINGMKSLYSGSALKCAGFADWGCKHDSYIIAKK